MFESSQDRKGVNTGSLFWDYSREYWVEDAIMVSLNKHLTLDYDFLGNDYFHLYIVTLYTIELFHESSQTTS